MMVTGQDCEALQFQKKNIHLGQTSLVETMSKVKISPFWKFYHCWI